MFTRRDFFSISLVTGLLSALGRPVTGWATPARRLDFVPSMPPRGSDRVAVPSVPPGSGRQIQPALDRGGPHTGPAGGWSQGRPAADAEDGLRRWRLAPRHPILESADATIARVLEAIEHGRRIQFHYQYEGVFLPGELRSVTPGQVFRVEGYPSVYMSGFSHDVAAERTFHIHRMRLSDPVPTPAQPHLLGAGRLS